MVSEKAIVILFLKQKALYTIRSFGCLWIKSGETFLLHTKSFADRPNLLDFDFHLADNFIEQIRANKQCRAGMNIAENGQNLVL